MRPKKEKRKSATGKVVKGFTDEERIAMKERAQELKAEARRGSRAQKADGEGDVLAKIAEMPEPERAMGERLHAIIKASAPENLVRDARVRQGRQCRLLLPKRAQVQGEIRDVRLQRQSEPRRRNRVAGRLCAEGVDRHRRGKDRRAREESGELRRSLHFQAQRSPPPNTLHQTAAMVKSAARPAQIGAGRAHARLVGFPVLLLTVQVEPQARPSHRGAALL